MRRKYRLFFCMLIAVLMLSVPSALAQQWKADISALTDISVMPVTAVHDLEATVSAAADRKTVTCLMSSSNGDVAKVDLVFAIEGLSLNEDQWNVLSDWMKAQTGEALGSVAADAESIAHAAAEGITQAQSAIQPDATGIVPLYADPRITLCSVTATLPYYEPLSNGMNSELIRRMQEKLKRLGYLDDEPDGYFGDNTEAAVKALETYIRQLEQDAINTHVDEPEEVQPEPTTSTVFGDVQVLSEDYTEEYKASHPKYEPQTEVDGVAESELQAFFLNDSFPAARRLLNNETEGADVERLQRRLKALGFLVDEPDGHFGDNTTRAVVLFQHYNGIAETGDADIPMQKLLYSDAVKKPDHPMMMEGSTGDEVKNLQKRLRVTGFGTLEMDGQYGTSTTTAVKLLQQYMRNREIARLKTQYPGEENVSSRATIAVNGIADPLLLDAFFADDFPTVLGAVTEDSSEDDIKRLQRRLNTLEYYYSDIDGKFGSGTTESLKQFQERNELEADGIAGTETMQALFNENAKRSVKPYMLKVSTDDQRVYVYKYNKETEDYDILEHTFKCSTGKNSTPTPKGTYQEGTGPHGSVWHKFTKYNCWAKYCFTIDGDVLFHSVLFSSDKSTHPTSASVHNLGRKASHGCVRLAVEDAQWIWENCPKNTKVIVY